jgi:outer membrane protein assembly factor BamD (BamD/ComL family)
MREFGRARMSWSYLRRCGWVGLLLAGAALVAGCASFRQPKTEIVDPAPTPEQTAWWEANRERAKYIPSRGYYVEGTSGYFDDQGRPVRGSLSSGGFADEFEEEDGTALSAFSPKKFNANFKKMIGKGPNEAVAKAAYAEGDALFRQAKYKQAAEKFKVAFERWPDSPQEEDAIFKCAECYFFADRYPSADDKYSLVTKKYPSSQYLDRVVARRFAIARYWEQHHLAHPHYPLTPNFVDKTRPKFDTRGHALRVYDRVRLDDPTGPLADDSIMASANSYFTQSRYEDADYYYTLLRHEYPKSEHQFDAHLLGLRSKLLKYQGPEYNGKPLDEADELAAQLLAQFAAELGEERERVVEVRTQIRAQKALREFAVANYYYKNKYYGAARLYYEGVTTAYPDTKLAQESQAKIDLVKDEPAAPTPPFAWISKILPESKTGSLGNGVATSGLPAGMGAAPTGIGTLGGMGGGMPATVGAGS